MPCENTECGCDDDAGLIQDGRPFCSAHCVRSSEDGGGGDCDCGHPACFPRGDELEAPARSKGAGA